MKMNYIKLFCILFIMLLGSCQATEDFKVNAISGENQFLLTPPSQYSIAMTRSNGGKVYKMFSGTGDMCATVTDEEWGKTYVSTRSNSLMDKVEWEDSVRVGLYLANTNGTIDDKLRNIPLNPITHKVYQEYCPKNFNMTLGADLFTEETDPVVSGAAYFWDKSKWSKGTLVHGKNKSFYAFYPRPYDMNKSQDWLYIRNSVVDIKKLATSYSWNKISYDFWTNETDENLHLFDLMYSLSETSGVEDRYGNQNKDGKSSIQMPFLHAFCLLDINVEKGNYQGDFSISSIEFSGANVSTSGILDIKDGTLTQTGANGIITKTVDTSSNKSDELNTAMIVPPVTGDINLACTVDGAKYKCSLSNIDFKSGYKYKVNLKMQANGEIYLQVWKGATVTINGNQIEGKEYALTRAERNTGKFIVSGSSGYKVARVLKNGKEITLSKGVGDELEYNFETDPKEKTYYTIVTEPTDWYAVSDKIRIQYDGLRNNPYKESQDNTSSSWTDLSGHGYDGQLENFNLEDGWSGKGLTFDGIKSIVTFPGTINSTEYTMEFYIFMEETQNTGGTPRLIAEGTDYPAYYFRYSKTKNQWDVGLYGHGNGHVQDMGKFVDFGKYIMQFDFVYSNKQVKEYTTYWLNGKKVQTTVTYSDLDDDAKEIPKASLGRRITDFTRALTGTYYSFILYDKALGQDEVDHNFEINHSRYGDQK